MTKLIITNNSDLSDEAALSFALSVVQLGRTSYGPNRKQYSRASYRGDYQLLVAKQFSGTETFTITKYK